MPYYLEINDIMNHEILTNSINNGMIFSDPEHIAFGCGKVSTISVSIGEIESRTKELLAETEGLFVLLPFDYNDSALIIVPSSFNLLKGNYSQELRSLSKEITPNGFGYEVWTRQSSKDWMRTVSRTIGEIRHGSSGLMKAVLSREMVVKRKEVIKKAGVLSRLASNFPTTQLFSIGSIVGASPEVIASVRRNNFSSCVLAGTSCRSNITKVDEQMAMDLIQSKKDRQEHEWCKKHMIATLKAFVNDLNYSDEPEVFSITNVHHLATKFSGKISVGTSVLSIAMGCHRSPAIVGAPVELANAWISDNEPHKRGYYSGAAGWVNRNGEGQFALTIRSMEIEHNEARLMVGNGIIADSDPKSEIAELEAKIQMILATVIGL